MSISTITNNVYSKKDPMIKFLQLDLIKFFDKIPQAFISYTYRSIGAEFGMRFEIVVRVKARDLLAACDADGAHFLSVPCRWAP